LLLEVLLCQILQVALAHRNAGVDGNLGLITGNLNVVTKVACSAFDLNSIVQELLLLL